MGYPFNIPMLPQGADRINAAINRYSENNPGEIDLILLDMIMPKQGGHTTFHKLKALDPNVTVLLSSGFVSQEEVDDLLQNGAAGFLPKSGGSSM